MKAIYQLALAAFAGAALGAAGVSNIHAKADGPAYVINEIDVQDAEGFKSYADRQGDLIKAFGGRFLARGGKTETIAGTPPRQRTTIYVFDSIERMHAWRDAPEQKELTTLRDKSSTFRSLAVEGLPK